MNTKTIFIIVLLALISFPGFIRSQEFTIKTDEKNIKDYFWNPANPKNNLIEIPEKWKNESAVFLKNHTEHIVFKTPAMFNNIYLKHMIIKLQDKAAVEKFSVFYADNYKQRYQTYNKHNIYYSFKITKPDGTENEINTKEEVIKEEGSNYKREKIAIPGLEVGDILDFYWYSYDYSKTKEAYYGVYYYPIADYYRNLQDDYPVLDFSLKIRTDKSYRVELASYNGAPEFTKKKVNENRFEFSIGSKDLDKKEEIIWTYPLRTEPCFKALVQYERDFQKKLLKENNTSYCVSKLDRKDIIKKYESYFKTLKSANNEYESYKRYLVKHNKENVSEDKKVEELYYFFRHLFINKHLMYDEFTMNYNRSTTDYLYVCHMFWGLHKMNIPYELDVIVSKRYGTVNDLINISECNNYILKANCKKPLYIFKPDKLALFNTIPYLVEGTKALKISTPDGKLKNLKIEEITLPKSNYTSNVTMNTYGITINEDNPNILNIKGNLSAKGHNADDYKEELLISSDFVYTENDIYGTKRWGDVAEIKNQNQVEKLNQLNADKQKERLDNLTKTLTGDFSIKPENIEFKLITPGNWVGDSIFSMDFSCTVEGLLTRAGNNYILNVGKCIGEQVTIDEKSMTRTADIYMSHPRSYRYNIDITIPEGYKISGIEKLESSVKNETGGFECKPVLEGNKLSIQVYKYYIHDFEPVKNWPLMLEFLKAANTFSEQKLLISK